MSRFTDGELIGGIDLGGSKIEAALFDGRLQRVDFRRRATPTHDYGALLDAIAGEITFLREQSGHPALPVGMGFPGITDARTGLSFASNLPCNRMPLATDIRSRVGDGSSFVLANDLKCFTLSEANGGAGDGYRTVFGLILGTGLGGGFCIDGQLVYGRNSVAGEIGHGAIPNTLVQRYELPILKCGCGRDGCYETLVSGHGLANLANACTGRAWSAPELAEAAAGEDPDAERVLSIWTELAGEFLHSLQLHLDPDCIVLGGGLSNMADIEERLLRGLVKSALPGLNPPHITKAKFGDSSGARGAAMLARNSALQGMTQ